MSMRGTGLYIRGLNRKKHGTPKQAAKKAADHGLSHVAIMSDWQDYRKGKFTHLRGNMRANRWVAYAKAFKDAGIDVGLWFYPWAGHEERLLEGLDGALKFGLVDYLLPDPELGFKWKSKGRGQNALGTMRGGQKEAISGVLPNGTKKNRQARATILMRGLQELSHKHKLLHGVGLTSYGIAKYHRTLPWHELLEGADWLSPQLYTASAKMVDRGIEQWRELADDADQLLPMIPSIGTFGEKSGNKMHDHLSTFVDGTEGVDGFIGWSWRQTSRDEWRILARWGEWLQKGLCR